MIALLLALFVDMLSFVSCVSLAFQGKVVDSANTVKPH